MATYVCSDIHGNFDIWLSAIKKSGISLDNGDQLVILGDLIDRGPDSLACVNYALMMKEKLPEQVTYLMGNHEKMFLDFVQISNAETPEGYTELMIAGQHWYLNGGIETVKSLLGFVPDTFYESHKLINKRHFDLIKRLINLPFYKIDEVNNCVYVHAGFASNVELENQHELDMIWIRDDFFNEYNPVKGDVLENKLIVHGHTPVQYMKDYNGEGFYRRDHHLCVDGGASLKEKILIVKMDDFSYTESKIMQIDDLKGDF